MSSNSSNSSTEGGNTISPSLPKTKQISPAKRWSFTLNNFDDNDIEVFSSIVPECCDFGIIGREGKDATPHLQGYIEFKIKKRPKSVFSYSSKIHWEKAKGSRADNIKYCSKEGDVCLHYPKPKIVKTISPDMFKPWEIDIINFLKQEADDRTIHWYWSKVGGIGKTSFCKYLVIHENCIVLGGKACDCRNGVIEYAKANNGDTPERIIINIPRSFAEEYVSYEAFENLKDMIFYSGKYEGGMVCGNCPHLFIFANFSPDIKKMSADRWYIHNIDEETISSDESWD